MDQWTTRRHKMVEGQIVARSVGDARVLEAMRKVERHLFVPHSLQALAYSDEPLPIGHGQTISQPYIVAYMTEALAIQPDDRVMEIGTGSGYQAAVLAELAKEVYTVESVEPLATSAARRLAESGYSNITCSVSDGYGGLPEEAPFDAIMVTAAPPEMPEALIGQLKVGGRMVVPVGEIIQELCLVTRQQAGFDVKSLIPVRFVPMIRKL